MHCIFIHFDVYLLHSQRLYFKAMNQLVSERDKNSSGSPGLVSKCLGNLPSAPEIRFSARWCKMMQDAYCKVLQSIAVIKRYQWCATLCNYVQLILHQRSQLAPRSSPSSPGILRALQSLAKISWTIASKIRLQPTVFQRSSNGLANMWRMWHMVLRDGSVKTFCTGIEFEYGTGNICSFPKNKG